MADLNWAAVNETGDVVRGPAIESGLAPALQFGADPAYDLSALAGYTGGHVRFLWFSGSTALWQGQNTGNWLMNRGGPTPFYLGPSYGTYPVAIGGGNVYAQDSAKTYTVNGASTPIPAHLEGTSQGICSAQPLRWMDDNLTGNFGAHPVARIAYSGRWAVAQSQEEEGLILAWDGVTCYEAWRGMSPVYPRITQQQDGSAIVCISLPSVQIHSYAFTEYHAPVKPVDPTPPIDPPVHPVDPPVHPVDPPVTPPVEPVDMRVSIVSTPELGFVVEEVKHPDAGRVGLKRADGKYLTVDRISGEIRWSDNLAGWEGFYPSQTSYAAVMDDGTARIFPKGPVFA